ncbi:hypothetical protein AOA12_04765 [Microbacterium sp. No. 7]|nr:hypothetical protein AOA12_04765 [Microbacterium sp. No. 7]
MRDVERRSIEQVHGDRHDDQDDEHDDEARIARDAAEAESAAQTGDAFDELHRDDAEGEGRDREVQTAHPCQQPCQNAADDRRHDEARDEGDGQRHAERRRDVSARVSADAEQRAVRERELAAGEGEVEAQGTDRIDAEQDQEQLVVEVHG